MMPDYLPCTIITNLVTKTFSPSFVLTDICNCLIIQSGEEGNEEVVTRRSLVPAGAE